MASGPSYEDVYSEIGETYNDETRTLSSINTTPIDRRKLVVKACEEEGDKTAKLSCSECQEQIQYVEDKHGAVCGCEEMPKEWAMEKLEVNNEN